MACEVLESLAGFVGVNAGFSLSSDLVAQWLEGVGEDGVDWARAAMFTGSGVAFQGMTQFARHYAVDIMFPDGPELWIALGKTGVNQVVFAPVLRATSMGLIRYLQTRSWEDVKEKLKSDFVETQSVSYLIKPASNFIAFAAFPSNLVGQAVVLRSLGFAYTVYYSYMVNRDLREAKKQKEDGEEEEEEEDPKPLRLIRRRRLRKAGAVEVPGSGDAGEVCERAAAIERGGPAAVTDIRDFIADRNLVVASARRHRMSHHRLEQRRSDMAAPYEVFSLPSFLPRVLRSPGPGASLFHC